MLVFSERCRAGCLGQWSRRGTARKYDATTGASSVIGVMKLYKLSHGTSYSCEAMHSFVKRGAEVDIDNQTRIGVNF